MPVKAFFDGSHEEGGWKRSRYIALAGYALNDNDLRSFEDGWQQVLDDDRHRPRAPYLHMRELRSEDPMKPFTRAKGWDDAKRERLVADLIDYLASSDKSKNRYFSCGVNNSAVLRHARPFPSALRICTHYCCSYVMKWYIDNNPGLFTGIHAFFDESEPFKKDFDKLRKKVTSDRFEIAANKESWELVKTGTDVYRFQDYHALQAADLMAWATLRQMNPTGFLNGLAVRIKKERFTSWSIWNETNLDEINLPFR